jgi:hypothetical protein
VPIKMRKCWGRAALRVERESAWFGKALHCLNEKSAAGEEQFASVPARSVLMKCHLSSILLTTCIRSCTLAVQEPLHKAFVKREGHTALV